MRAAEIVEQLLVRRRFLQRIQVATVQVLEQGIAEHGVVASVADDGGDRREAGPDRCAPPALAHDQFVSATRQCSYDDRLQQSDFADRLDQLRHGVFVEDCPGLPRVR
jgi:hypothetical protein